MTNSVLPPMNNIHYFNILWNSTVDGPGIRTVLFLQGCHLNCPWCHSPHSQAKITKLLLYEDRCILCGSCITACKNQVHSIIKGKHLVDRSKCLGCRDCVYACSTVSSSSGLSGALSFPGEISEPEKLFDKLHPQLDLLKNIGGLTISGGEPLLQYKAIKQLLRLCRENKINTAVETSGSVPLKNLKWISGFVDVWLIGLRPIPENIHNYRLANMTMVESNLSFLSAAKKKIIIRTPVIPGYFFHKDQIEGVISIMKKHHLNYVELLPYNEFSSHFYEALGVDFPLKDVSGISSAMMQEIARLFETNNIKTKIVT